jgi:hypothetical protein
MTIENEDTVVGQLAHADSVYMTGATGMAVQDDLNARVALANATHTAVTNAELDTELSSVLTDNGRVTGESYSGGNVVTPVNATWFETHVRTALDADALFDTGGAYTSDYSVLSPYMDPMVLIQGSILTGEKFY